MKASIASRVVRDMKSAVRLHGSANPKENPELARIIQYAKGENVSGATIDRTLASCVASKDKPVHNLVLELKGPAGSLMIVELATANVKKARQEVNILIKKHVCSVADGGGILHLFDQKTMVTAKYARDDVSAEILLEKAEETGIEVDAEEVLPGSLPGEVIFVCDPMAAGKLVKAIQKMDFTVVDTVSEYLPKTVVELQSAALDELRAVKAKLEEHEDFMNIYLNCAT